MRVDLRRLRLDRGESRAQVAAATGLTSETIRLWEREAPTVRSARLSSLSALLAHYGMALAVVPATENEE